MNDLAQTVAALAGGALLAVASMLLLKLHRLQRRAEQERRIEAAARAAVEAVETFRQRTGSDHQQQVPEGSEDNDVDLLSDAMEVRSKRHLTMLTY
ncbi:hypothetical protein ACFY3G_17680 [Streptomyces phaeochromogenes]|uniref:hypothetical protein n=1 Tax=Streptomyces phaeochromogenes TaxID=1923 RepID=UPI0036903BA5